MSKKSFKLSEIADFLGGQLFGDASKTVSEIKTLLEADKDSISLPVKAGSVAIFSSLTPHRTGPNLTDGIRKTYILQIKT